MRPDIDHYFLQIAAVVALRATCPRKQVGCVLVLGRLVVSAGYNGSVAGLPHCTDVGCDMENNHCASVVHAECNAIAQAARRGACIDGAISYTTINPCWNCFKLLVNAGVNKFVYREVYHLDPRVVEAAKELHLELVELPSCPR